VLASGGGDDTSKDSAKDQPAERSESPTSGPSEDVAPSGPAEETPAADEPAAKGKDPPKGKDPAEGRRLNDQGFALIQQGRDADAVPILERSVAAFPDDSTEMDYAFALFNLGSALRASGRPADAIPFLEKRLAISNFKRGVVERELALAKRQAQ